MRARSLRVCARAALAALMTGAALGAAGTATASTTTASTATAGWSEVQGSTRYFIDAVSDSLVVAVSQARSDSGAPIIQWYNTGGTEQKWYVDQAYDSTGLFQGFMFRNANSGQCITFDGTDGDTLTQQICNPTNGYQRWSANPGYDGANIFTNAMGGYAMDVYGNSWGAGANIDAHWLNSTMNQNFWLLQAP